jgi:two-component system, LytTR family, sensor kinase
VTPEQLVQILHGVGFLTGVALYAMLLSMALRSVRDLSAISLGGANGLAVVTAGLGLIWNVGALTLVTGLHGPPALIALAYAALGLLPAVFVHAAVSSWAGDRRPHAFDRSIYCIAYALAAGAAMLQVGEAVVSGTAPSSAAFRVLAVGFVLLVPLMVLAAPPEARRRGSAVWAVAIVIFSISAWHLAQHETGHEGWSAVVLGHHASIPLALAILWLDFRFALADIFLKRALALLVLVAGVVGIYIGLTGPHLLRREPAAGPDPSRVVLVLALWAATALAYPVIRRWTAWFVDSVLLRRPDAAELRAEIARRITISETAPDVLELVCQLVGPALNAGRSHWEEAPAVPVGAELVRSEIRPGGAGVTVVVPTVEPPHYHLRFGSLGDGRRVLSDDVALLEAVGLMTARRLDALRWLHERCERDVREGEIAKLATEAELRALQAQLNPHFLFNALNTLGYLMKAAPERARGTLLDLTKLLRAVLKRSGGDVVTLGQELDLVESYLAIERVRFEDRLRLRLDVPLSIRATLVPPLIVQPLVENAIKHGISPRREGGEIAISARIETAGTDVLRPVLVIEVADTGVGATESAVRAGRARGVGLSNIEKRLRAHYGDDAFLSITSQVGQGTRVTVTLSAVLPVRRSRTPVLAAGGRT